MLASIPGVSLLWTIDANPAAVSAADVPAGVRVSTQIEDALGDGAVDCVIISTPTPSHASLAQRALEAGKQVFAEKPLCANAAEVWPLYECAAKRGLLLFTAR